MITASPAAGARKTRQENHSVVHLARTLAGCLGLALIAFFAGCETPPQASPITASDKTPEVLTIRAGDVLKIAFPGAPNLDTTQTVRRDGRITMPLGGEVVAAGLTPNGLEQELIKTYATQLISKEVSVTVVASNFSVFVSGAVIHPGKVVSDHAITVLEAIMEAGGFDNTKADMRAVVVTRQENGQYKNYTVNLKEVLEGRQPEPFYLKPSDVVFVRQKFSWF